MRSFIKYVICKSKLKYWRLIGRANEIPDEEYLRVLYCVMVKQIPNFRVPRTFNEKIQWLKLYDRRIEYTKMVDKYEVKKYVAGIIGETYIIPTLGVWNSLKEINYSDLPKRFVLKCTHNSGGVVIIRDKNTIDYDYLERKLGKELNINYYYYNREWPYKDVKPRIIAEKYMEDNSNDLKDYKVHCFNGVPRFIQVIGNRKLEKHSGNQLFYDFDWKDVGWAFGDYPPYNYKLEKPYGLSEMYDVASKLSRGTRYLRVDLYEINQKVYFGELTFYPKAGFYPYNKYYKYDTDLFLGSLISL